MTPPELIILRTADGLEAVRLFHFKEGQVNSELTLPIYRNMAGHRSESFASDVDDLLKTRTYRYNGFGKEHLGMYLRLFDEVQW